MLVIPYICVIEMDKGTLTNGILNISPDGLNNTGGSLAGRWIQSHYDRFLKMKRGLSDLFIGPFIGAFLKTGKLGHFLGQKMLRKIAYRFLFSPEKYEDITYICKFWSAQYSLL